MTKSLHENSIESYNDQKKKGLCESYRAQVYELIRSNPVGLTDRAIMWLLNETDPNNVRPEITRLKQDGLIKEDGKIPCSYSGKRVRVSVITGKPYFSRGKS